MDNFDGADGEFFVAGRATRVDDATLIPTASVGERDPKRYVLIELGVDEAIGTTYADDETVPRGWRVSRIVSLPRPGETAERSIKRSVERSRGRSPKRSSPLDPDCYESAGRRPRRVERLLVRLATLRVMHAQLR
jgi:hypothetical protein